MQGLRTQDGYEAGGGGTQAPDTDAAAKAVLFFIKWHMSRTFNNIQDDYQKALTAILPGVTSMLMCSLDCLFNCLVGEHNSTVGRAP